MRLSDIIRSANTNLLRNKGRSVLTIVAIFIGAFTIILTSGINTGVNNYIDKQMASAGGEGYLEIMPSSTLSNTMSQMGMSDNGIVEYNPDKNGSDLETISEEKINEVRAVPGMESADTYHQIEVEYITRDENDETSKKLAVPTISQMPTDSINVDMIAGKMVTTDAGQYQIALAPDYATELGFSSDNDAIGKKVSIAAKSSATSEVKTIDAIVTGVQNKSVLSMGGSRVNKSLSDEIHKLQTAGLPQQYADQAYFATAQLKAELTDEEVQNAKDILSDLGLAAMTTEDQVGMIKSFFDAMTLVLMMFGVIPYPVHLIF